MHATSAHKKLWPEERWITLGQALAEPRRAGSAALGQRSESASAANGSSHRPPGAVVPPRLTACRTLRPSCRGALGAVGVDTGLTHLAGALGVATVGIYSATDPAMTGLYGCARGVNVGGVAASRGGMKCWALERLAA